MCPHLKEVIISGVALYVQVIQLEILGAQQTGILQGVHILKYSLFDELFFTYKVLSNNTNSAS